MDPYQLPALHAFFAQIADGGRVATDTISMQQFARAALGSVIYVLIGLVFFGLSFWIIQKITPFSIRKEIEEDQNTALAIIIGSVIIGIALIISAAIHG